MADEITLNITLDLLKSNIRLSFRPGSVTPDVAGQYLLASVQQIGTSAYEGLGTGDVSSGGYAYFHNVSTSTTTDPTIRIALTATTSNPFAKLLPGDYAVMRNESVALSARATSAGTAASLQYGVIDP